MHSSTVRTLEPISRPVSQQAVMKPSMAVRSGTGSGAATLLARRAVAALGGSSTSTSTSECGNSSARP